MEIIVLSVTRVVRAVDKGGGWRRWRSHRQVIGHPWR
jgi:hypothetical protein